MSKIKHSIAIITGLLILPAWSRLLARILLPPALLFRLAPFPGGPLLLGTPNPVRFPLVGLFVMEQTERLTCGAVS